LVERTMNTIRTARTLTLGAALLGSCTERSIPTASRAVASETAAPLTSVATDSLGDVKNKYPAYVDVTRASVTRKGRSFIFTVDVAAPVPGDPTRDFPLGLDFLHVALFGLDTDQSSAPVGYPFKEGTARPFEFFIAVTWN